MIQFVWFGKLKVLPLRNYASCACLTHHLQLGTGDNPEHPKRNNWQGKIRYPDTLNLENLVVLRSGYSNIM
jgi:hypothetical protein